MTHTTSLSPTPQRYGAVAMALHWLLALGILGLLGFGWYMTGLPFSPQRLKLYNWHKWAGVIVLALSVLRLLWRWWQPPPVLPPSIHQAMPGWQRVLHQATLHGFYVLFLAVPLLGWAYSSAAGFQVVLFGVLPLPDFISADPAVAEAIKPWHGWMAYTLAVLVLLHVAGALKHHWIDRDGLLTRMLPGRD